MTQVLAEQLTSEPGILFLDDEAPVLDSLQRVFRRHSCPAYYVQEGEEALAILQQYPIAVVVSDMRMPGMDGVEFLQQVAERWPRCKRLLLTGYADMEATVNAINKGKIHGYLAKPWNNDELRYRVDQLLATSQLEQENARLLALTERQNAELEAANSELESRVAERTVQLFAANAELKEASLRMTDVMTGLLSLRDDHAASHGRRVAHIAGMLAKKLRLSEHTMEQIHIAALLHDIGKLGFSDEMLSEAPADLPVKLRLRYEKHSVVAEASLMSVAAFADAAAYIRMHHEYIDGSGFPDGLSGEDVPLPAQIIGLASYCDDLSQGLYGRAPLDGEELIRSLQKKAGRWWQEDLVTLLVRLLHDDLLNCERAADRLMPMDDLEADMVLSRDVCTEDGRLLLSAGICLNTNIIAKIGRFQKEAGGALSFYVKANVDE